MSARSPGVGRHAVVRIQPGPFLQTYPAHAVTGVRWQPHENGANACHGHGAEGGGDQGREFDWDGRRLAGSRLRESRWCSGAGVAALPCTPDGQYCRMGCEALASTRRAARRSHRGAPTSPCQQGGFAPRATRSKCHPSVSTCSRIPAKAEGRSFSFDPMGREPRS